MGLEINVGLLGYFLEDEADSGMRPFTEDLDAVNDALRRAGLPRVSEPPADEVEPVELTLGPTSGLQGLRRLAAHAWAGRDLPPPSADPPEDDPLLVRYYESRGEDGAAGAPRFDHLILHPDSSGYYVPLDFEAVLVPDPSSVLAGEVGSSQRLGEELARLAELLEVPPALDPEDEELWAAYDSAGGASEGWRRHGVEAFVCVRLLDAARASVRSGALLVFG